MYEEDLCEDMAENREGMIPILLLRERKSTNRQLTANLFEPEGCILRIKHITVSYNTHLTEWGEDFGMFWVRIHLAATDPVQCWESLQHPHNKFQLEFGFFRIQISAELEYQSSLCWLCPGSLGLSPEFLVISPPSQRWGKVNWNAVAFLPLMLWLLSEQLLRVNSVITESDFTLTQQNKELLVIKTCKCCGRYYCI